jgi:uncharacterized protein (DUF2147 family)
VPAKSKRPLAPPDIEVIDPAHPAAKNPNDTDRHNPDVAKRNRSVIGMPVLLDLKPAKPNRREGRIYNPEDGKAYTSNISIKSPDVLQVEGCAFGGLICGGQNRHRE